MTLYAVDFMKLSSSSGDIRDAIYDAFAGLCLDGS